MGRTTEAMILRPWGKPYRTAVQVTFNFLRHARHHSWYVYSRVIRLVNNSFHLKWLHPFGPSAGGRPAPPAHQAGSEMLENDDIPVSIR